MLLPVDRHYIAAFMGDIPLLATRHVYWNFLKAAITFWNPSRAVFDIQGTELTPTIKEYQTLIGRTTVVHSIVEPNFHTARSTLQTVITERPYFPEHPTLHDRDFQATEKYISRFYRWGLAAHEGLVNSPRVKDGGSPVATPTPYMAIQAELTHLRAKRDRLCREVAEKDEQLVDQRQLQRELAQTRAELQRRDQELVRANVALERSRKRARRVHIHPRIDTFVGLSN
ncbi:hypothetical protein CRG98_023094 [Punica granatum]|uniref:Uncharacterized protein n=1 Tax=Punica granatum TaxID=22663 RepID=A0A2I0JLQ0_PUNGR|nr:hypothetical protein CRG98_023094 [Punica granatum]